MKGEGKGYGRGDGQKGIPKPIMYKGGPHMYAERKAKLLAYLMVAIKGKTGQPIAWTGEPGQPASKTIRT